MGHRALWMRPLVFLTNHQGVFQIARKPRNVARLEQLIHGVGRGILGKLKWSIQARPKVLTPAFRPTPLIAHRKPQALTFLFGDRLKPALEIEGNFSCRAVCGGEDNSRVLAEKPSQDPPGGQTHLGIATAGQRDLG
jgi:hypothetical protein